MNTLSEKSIQQKRSDEVYKIIAAAGCLLNNFSQLEFLCEGKQWVFRGGLKYSAQKFIDELQKAEQGLINEPGIEVNPVMMQQMADSYNALDTMMSLMLVGGRILTPEAMQMMNDEMIAVAEKWGVKLEQV